MEFKTFPTNFNKTLNALLTCLLLYSCTKQSLFEKAAYVFPGIGEAAIQNDGSLILSWEQVPSDPVSYSVYRRNKTEEFNWNKALEAVSTTTYKHPAYDLSTRYCFAVHFVQVGIDNDTNTEDICPDLPYVDGFIGIANVTSTETGTALITWEKPTTGADQVANYRVYVGTDFKSSVASAAPDATSITVTGLTPEELYTFGVRAVDKYGREDANTLTRQVTIINNSAPTFSGLTSAKKASASSVTLSWAAADGRPKEY